MARQGDAGVGGHPAGTGAGARPGVHPGLVHDDRRPGSRRARPDRSRSGRPRRPAAAALRSARAPCPTRPAGDGSREGSGRAAPRRRPGAARSAPPRSPAGRCRAPEQPGGHPRQGGHAQEVDPPSTTDRSAPNARHPTVTARVAAAQASQRSRSSLSAARRTVPTLGQAGRGPDVPAAVASDGSSRVPVGTAGWSGSSSRTWVAAADAPPPRPRARPPRPGPG